MTTCWRLAAHSSRVVREGRVLRVDSVEGLLGVRTPFAYPISAPSFRLGSAAVLVGLTPIFGYTRMHNFAPAYLR